MCGFYFTNNSISIYESDYSDVKERGLEYKIFEDNDFWAIQSILPCMSGKVNFNHIDTRDYSLFFVGELYNYDRENFDNEVEFLGKLISENIHNVGAINGMFSFVYYDKINKLFFVGRDRSGQIPLFFSLKDGLTVSTTIKSMVKNLEVEVNPKALTKWKTSKHYIWNDTFWKDIQSVPAGNVIIFSEDSIVNNFSIHEQNYFNEHTDVVSSLFELKPLYTTPLKAVSIDSGGIDSGVISALFEELPKIALNHKGKDYISNKLDWAIEIDEETWCSAVDEFIEKTYTVPYTWSWVSYYILGKHLKNKYNVLYTGEGADEIFGGYPDYTKGIRSPYSLPFEESLHEDPVVNNKLLDQKYFIPTAVMGANLALGCSTIEPRSPFLDKRFFGNNNFLLDVGKKNLTALWEGDIPVKQGFAGFPGEYYKRRFNKDCDITDNNYFKEACFDKLGSL